MSSPQFFMSCLINWVCLINYVRKGPLYKIKKSCFCSILDHL